MKRKLLLTTLLVALFVCLFIVSVSAVTGSTSDEFGEVTVISGLNANTTITDKESRVVLINADGTYSTYPTYYISDLELQWQGTTQYSFDNLNEATGEEYSIKSIVRIEILHDATIWNSNGGYFHDNTNLVEVKFTPGTQITSIGGQIFKGCTNLKKINIPATCTDLGWLCFENCRGLEEITFDEGGTDNITFGGPSFQNCVSLEEVVLPERVTSISKSVFQSCSSLTEVHFPQGFETITTSNFIYGTKSSVTRLYLPITAEIATISTNCSYATIITPGTQEQVSALGFETVYSYEEFVQSGMPSGKAIVYGCCSSLVYTSKHNVIAINSCVNACSGCDAKEQNPNPIHIFDKGVIAYANGYASNGTFTVTCQNAGCICNTNPSIEAVAPIFELLGFATNMNKTKMVAGYVFNADSYSAYGKELSFGVVAYIPDSNTCAPLTVNEGVVTPIEPEYTIFAEVTSTYNSFDFLISGIPQEKITLAMCAYVYDGESISYLNYENGALAQNSVAYTYEIENGTVTKK